MPRLNRRGFLKSVGITAAAAAFEPFEHSAHAADSAAGPELPNILFILADDLGYADLSCYGRRDYETPVLDQLAAEGLRFTQAYSNSSVCSPTRLALATGRYQYRLEAGLEEPIGATPPDNKPRGLPPDHPTIASQLRRAGYRTALIGKWHLGALPDYGPLKSGYEEFFGISGGGVDYASHGLSGRPDLYEGERPVEVAGYLTELLSNRAVEYIAGAKRRREPFFLSLHFTAPHWPWQAPGDGPVAVEQSLFHFAGGSLEIYSRMVRSLDSGIGRVLGALRNSGLDESTLVIFTSDNGGERFSDNWPFVGQKLDLLEGGIRVPQIVRWTGEIAGGAVTEQVAITMDWMPTLLSLGGAAPDPELPPDGLDLSATLRGTAQISPRTLFWRLAYRNQAAIRAGDWKYLRIGDDEFLFDLRTDVRERANRRADEPRRFADLKMQWESWNASMLPASPARQSYFDGGDLAGYHDRR
jgi:arylsulfatase A-like enzyme